MSSDLDPADIEEYISYFEEYLEQISSSKELQEAYDDMCSKGARVIDAARESRKVLDPLLDSFTASHRWLVNELRELGVLKDAESLSGPSNFAKGMEMSNKVARQKSPKESEK